MGNLPWNGLGRPDSFLLNEKTTDTAADWLRIHVEQPSIGVVRFNAGGTIGQHLLLYSPWQPRDGDVAAGIYIVAPAGDCQFQNAGDWWIYCPALDPANPVSGIPFIVGQISVGSAAPGAQQSPATQAASQILAQNQAVGQGQIQGPAGSMPSFRVENYTLLGTSNTGQAVNPNAFVPPEGFTTVILNPCSNTGDIWIAQTQIGFSIGAAIRLCPGEAIGLRIRNWNIFWLFGTAGDIVTLFVESYLCHNASSSTNSSSSSSSSSAGP